MKDLRASTIEELCQTLGIRAPFGVTQAAQLDLREKIAVQPLTDEQLTALSVLAQPEAIAVVARDEVVHVIATRGPWMAEHVIDGATHHLHATDSDHAASVLLERAGFVEASPSNQLPRAAIDVTFDAYRRMTELVRAGDPKRAGAALVAEGAPLVAVAAAVEAIGVGVTEVAGLGSDGRRFLGCELAVAGSAATGRWLVPATQRVDAPNASRHPSLSNVRVRLEPVDADDLVDELALIFGEA